MTDNKNPILDAAEKLFAEAGYDRASLREITACAGVNLAAVNYHFSSKEALLQAVFARKLSPLNRKRLALLDALERETGGAPVPAEKLVRALLEPVVRLLAEPFEGGLSFGRLLGRVYTTPTHSTPSLFFEEMRPFVRRFSCAFGRALPGLSPEEISWRVFFGIGAMSQILAAGWMLPQISEAGINLGDVDGIVDRLIRFVAAGLSAPPNSRHAAPGPDRSRSRKPAAANSRTRTK